MKRIFLSAIAFVLLVTLAFSVTAAEPGDYGYYDQNGDGKVEIVDVLDVLRGMLNDNEDVELIRVLRTLKITTTCEVVDATIKSMDYDTRVATLFYDDIEAEMSFSQLGLDNVPNIAFYEQGIVTMSVPSPAADFFASYSASSVYAAAAEIRYDMNVLEVTVGNASAKLNGEELTLAAEPVMHGDAVMLPADTLADILEATVAWDATTSTATYKTSDTVLEMMLDSANATVNGEATTAAAPLVIIDSHTYVPAKFVAETFGATVVWDADTQTMTIMQQFYPTVYLGEVSGAAGEEVTVTAYIKHNPGVAGFEFKIGYDSSVMSYVSGKSENGNFYIATSSTAGANPVKVVAANLSLKNITGDLTVATVTFKIADDTASGSYAFNIEGFKAYDSDIIELQVKTENSTLTVN